MKTKNNQPANGGVTRGLTETQEVQTTTTTTTTFFSEITSFSFGGENINQKSNIYLFLITHHYSHKFEHNKEWIYL